MLYHTSIWNFPLQFMSHTGLYNTSFIPTLVFCKREHAACLGGNRHFSGISSQYRVHYNYLYSTVLIFDK